MQRILVAVLAGCAFVLMTACGGASSSNSNATPRVNPTTATTSAIAPPIPPTPDFAAPAPGVTPPATPPTAVRIDPAPGSKFPYQAPIRDASVSPSAESPSRYVLHVVVGLFGVCAEQGTQDVSRDGTVINVNVTNLRTANVTCQLPESTYELDIDLPGAFVSGTQYIVNVNGKAVPFTAQ